MKKTWLLWNCVVLSVLLLTSCAKVVSPGSDAGTGGTGGATGAGGTGGGGGVGGTAGGSGSGGGGVETTIAAIAFTDSGTNEVKLATKDGDTWSFETVEGFSQPAGYVTMAFDSSGAPHLAYQDPISKVLKYATRSGATWVTQVADSAPDTGAWAFLAIDDQDRPHIAYVGSGTEVLHAVKDGSTWSVDKVVDALSFAVGNISLFIDDAGGAHISYLDDQMVRYSAKQASWATETVRTYTNVGFESRTSLVVDAAGTPHITVYDLAAGLHHVEKIGGQWVDEVVAPGTMATGQYSSLHLTSDGQLACGYADFGAGAAKLALHDGESWTLETVDDDIAKWVVGLSMALDQADNPYMSYHDSDGNLLRMAVKLGGVWVVETVEPAVAVSSLTSIALKAGP